MGTQLPAHLIHAGHVARVLFAQGTSFSTSTTGSWLALPSASVAIVSAHSKALVFVSGSWNGTVAEASARFRINRDSGAETFVVATSSSSASSYDLSDSFAGAFLFTGLSLAAHTFSIDTFLISGNLGMSIGIVLPQVTVMEVVA
jgi:hypothetical protein